MSSSPGVNWGKVAALSVAALLVLFLIGLVLRGCNIVGGYVDEGQRVVSVDNVKEQNAEVIRNWEAMKSIALNLCRLEESTQSGENDSQLLEDPSFSYAAQYEEPRQQYQRRMDDIYKARAVRGLPLPHNLKEYPRRAPSLEQMQARECPAR